MRGCGKCFLSMYARTSDLGGKKPEISGLRSIGQLSPLLS